MSVSIPMILDQEVGLLCNIMSKSIQLGNNFALYVQLVHPLKVATASSCQEVNLQIPIAESHRDLESNWPLGSIHRLCIFQLYQLGIHKLTEVLDLIL